MALLAKKMSLPPQCVLSVFVKCHLPVWMYVIPGFAVVFWRFLVGGWVDGCQQCLLWVIVGLLCALKSVLLPTPLHASLSHWLFWILCACIWKVRLFFPFLLRKSLAFWWELTHIYRSFWLVWSFWQYESINMQCFSQLHAVPLTSVL